MPQAMLPGYGFTSETDSGQSDTMLPGYGFVNDAQAPPVAPAKRNRIVILTHSDSISEGDLQT